MKLAWRALRSSRPSSVAALVSFALGIGATVGIFSVLDALVLRPLPVAHPEQLVTISSDMALRLGFDAGLGWNGTMWTRLRDRRDLAASALAWMRQSFSLSTGAGRERVDVLVADGLFETLGLGVAAGRPLVASDEASGGGPDGPAVVLSYDFWQRHFDGAPGVIGSTIQIERVPFTVVGVTPATFLGLAAGQTFDVMIPLGTTPLVQPGRSVVDRPEQLLLLPMLRLRPGQSVNAATQALRAAQADLIGPGRLPEFVKAPFVLVSAARGVSKSGSDVRDRYTRPLVILLGIAGVVCLLACGNIANLLLARGVARQREFGIHLALGAQPRDVVRAVALESAMLAIAGGALGLLTAMMGARMLVSAVSTSASPVALHVAIDWRVLAFTTAVAATAAVFFGLVPAIRAGRVPALEALRAPRTSGHRRGIGTALLVVQVAASYALVVAAGLMSGSYGRLVDRPLGFAPSDTLVVSVDTASAQVGGSRLDYFERLLASVRRTPGVEAAGASFQAPLAGGLPQQIATPSQPTGNAPALVRMVTPDWFHAIGTRLIRGRDFDDRDVAGAQPVAVVNDAFVLDVLREQDALDQIVNGRRIVGVVASGAVAGGYRANGASWSLRDEPPAAMYVPIAQAAGLVPPDRTTLVVCVRALNGSADRAAAAVTTTLLGIDRELAVSIRPLGASVDDSLAQERLVAWLSGVFAAIGLVLAGVGLYAVTAYLVDRQRVGIAIRLALGATQTNVFASVVGRTTASITAGLGTGIVLTLWLSRFVSSLVYGVSPRDPTTLASATIVLATVGVATAVVPALRASRVNPVELLRRV